MRVFYIGAPGAMGGANTEMGHTIPVWRRAGIDVTVVPAWTTDLATEARLRGWGCEVHKIGKPECIGDVPSIKGVVVVSMCCSPFWKVYGPLRKLDCKTVWSPAMCFEYADAITAFKQFGMPHAHHFQSEFQRAWIETKLRPLKPRGHVIHGAFDFAQMPFNPAPHKPAEPFVIGRLARPDLDKLSSNIWPILRDVPYTGKRALVMGWNPRCTAKAGPPPPWAECLAPQKIPVNEFLSRCHAMIGLNGGAWENWPRIGLEAMAAGVPLVVQDQWGWKEMIQHGETGFLSANDHDFRFYLALLARCEETRQKVIRQARAHVERIADPIAIGQQWKDLFESLGG